MIDDNALFELSCSITAGISYDRAKPITLQGYPCRITAIPKFGQWPGLRIKYSGYPLRMIETSQLEATITDDGVLQSVELQKLWAVLQNLLKQDVLTGSLWLDWNEGGFWESDDATPYDFSQGWLERFTKEAVNAIMNPPEKEDKDG